MKLLISTLLLSIVVFLTFGELNAADNPGINLGSGRKRGRPRGSETRRVDGILCGTFKVGDSRPVPVEGPSIGFIEHMGQKIEVWLDSAKTRVTKADFPGNTFPVGSTFYRRNKFLVRRSMVGGRKMVEYISENGELMGIRAPKPTTANVMEPNDRTWFIVFFGKYFRITINPITRAAERIELIPKNVHEDGHTAEVVDIAGFKFKVFRGGPNSGITGAALLS